VDGFPKKSFGELGNPDVKAASRWQDIDLAALKRNDHVAWIAAYDLMLKQLAGLVKKKLPEAGEIQQEEIVRNVLREFSSQIEKVDHVFAIPSMLSKLTNWRIRDFIRTRQIEQKILVSLPLNESGSSFSQDETNTNQSFLSQELSPDERTARDDQINAMMRCLSEEDRDFVLELLESTYVEVARRWNMTKKQVENKEDRIYRELSKLRERFE
jgi:hypothetical protein